MIKSANISACQKHRFELKRVWDESLPQFVVIGLNPSTADATEDDPTIRRCIGFAKREGCGSLIMLNLFSYRATNPKELKGKTLGELTMGRNNDVHVKSIIPHLHNSAKVVCAWGTHGGLLDQDKEFFKMLRWQLYAFGFTKDGFPKHPLYLPLDCKLEHWDNPFESRVRRINS